LRNDSYIIRFTDVSLAEANQYAGSLAESLRDVDPGIEVAQRRDKVDTQDFGATLALVLGTASVTALAQGIASWISRNSGAHIEISTKGRVVASNLNSKDAARIAEAFSSHP
jgi:hypothetical protein